MTRALYKSFISNLTAFEAAQLLIRGGGRGGKATRFERKRKLESCLYTQIIDTMSLLVGVLHMESRQPTTSEDRTIPNGAVTVSRDRCHLPKPRLKVFKAIKAATTPLTQQFPFELSH